MDEMDDFFGNDDFDREPSPIGDEAIEDNRGEGRKVIEPKLLRTKKTTNPRLALNEATLTGSKGIPALREAFKGFKPNPKDDPYTNLDKMMKKYAYWGHLMFPKMKTEDVLSRVETLGTRRLVKVYLAKQRLGESTDDIEEETKRKRDKNGIIDDGAEEEEENRDHDELFDDLPEKESSRKSPPKPSQSTVKSANVSPVKVMGHEEDEEEEYRQMEEERRREEQEARDADAEDELMEDFGDMNNDW